MYHIVSCERTLYGALTDPYKKIFSNPNNMTDQVEDGMYVHTIRLEMTELATVQRSVTFKAQ